MTDRTIIGKIYYRVYCTTHETLSLRFPRARHVSVL